MRLFSLENTFEIGSNFNIECTLYLQNINITLLDISIGRNYPYALTIGQLPPKYGSRSLLDLYWDREEKKFVCDILYIHICKDKAEEELEKLLKKNAT